MTLTQTALTFQERMSKYQLRKCIGRGYCPNCCRKFKEDTRQEEDQFGNVYCAECGTLEGIISKPRNKKEQKKWKQN
jgi:hypothetical protein